MTRLEKLKAALPAGVDGLLVSSEINQRWLTEFNYTDGYVLVTREKSYLVTDFRYTEAAEKECAPGFEVVESKGGFKAFLCGLLEENHVKVLAYEDRDLTCAEYRMVSGWFEAYELTPIGGLVEGLREYKDADEIENIIRAQRIAEQAFQHILGYISPERTEIDVALELEFFMRSHGAECVSFETIAISGSASSVPHGVPRNCRLERGFITMDYGCKVKGYCSDMTRTVVLGKADAKMKHVYNTVLEAQLAAIDAAKEGCSLKGLDTIARDIIYGAGYEGCFGHGLGHGVGLEIHEAPRCSQGAGEACFTRGHVVTCEPGIYLIGKYGVRIEDMLICDEGGVRDITDCPKELIEL